MLKLNSVMNKIISFVDNKIHKNIPSVRQMFRIV